MARDGAALRRTERGSALAVLLAALVAGCLAGCGQKGALYLPEPPPAAEEEEAAER